jgi:3-oxoacyl-[acyl-carrier-protein] synthase II
MGMVSPLGEDCPSSWAAFRAGRVGVRRLQQPWAEDLPVAVAAPSRVPIGRVMAPNVARRLDRSAQLAVLAALEAWTAAGPGGWAAERRGVVIGTGNGGIGSMAGQMDQLRRRGPAGVNPLAVSLTMPNAVAAQVSIALGARGPLESPVSACASGADAILWAARLLRSGEADVVVAGGTDALVNRFGLAAFAALRALSRRGDDPETASRPFADDRDGFVMGEGAGALVLEREEDARARGATVQGWLLAGAVSSDAHSITTPLPHGLEAERAMRQALRNAGLSPADLALVKGHGTGTLLGDQAEAEALARLFASLPPGERPWLLAPKAQIGHLIGASGAVEAIFTLLCLGEALLPAQRNCPRPLEALPLAMPRAEAGVALADRAQVALANSFGFGGKNVALVLQGPG